jgi:hypothetical protein
MKTKNIIRFTLILVFAIVLKSGIIFASTPASECANTLWQKFQGKISYPEFAYKQAIQGDVVVIFTVSKEGWVVVKDIRATDAELGKYVRNIISTMQAPELDNAGIYDFKVVFHFKLI